MKICAARSFAERARRCRTKCARRRRISSTARSSTRARKGNTSRRTSTSCWPKKKPPARTPAARTTSSGGQAILPVHGLRSRAVTRQSLQPSDCATAQPDPSRSAAGDAANRRLHVFDLVFHLLDEISGHAGDLLLHLLAGERGVEQREDRARERADAETRGDLAEGKLLLAIEH